MEIQPPTSYVHQPDWCEAFKEWRTSDIELLANILRMVLAARYSGPRSVASPLSGVDPRARGPESHWPPRAQQH